MITHIQNVIRDTVTPSWVESVPYNFGEAKAGKLKAYEWRLMASIYLPLALVSLWGEGSHQCSKTVATKLRNVLDHTMMLFSAVYLACLRTITEARLTAYHHYMKTYVEDLHKHHPHISYRPTHHMVLHLYDFLILFGPVQSWWCFPFERLIGMLQRMPNNHKLGKFNFFTVCSAYLVSCRAIGANCHNFIYSFRKT